MMDNNFDINQFSAKLKEEAEKMQSRLQDTQKQLTDMRVTGKAGGGMVSLVMNGRHDVIEVKINPALQDEELKIIEELIAAAINDAVKQVEKISQEKIAQLTSGLNNLGGFMGEGQ
jgi:DNA-binding YbaB/EbfC family protein